MYKSFRISVFFFSVFLTTAAFSQKADVTITVDHDVIVNESYIGNGAQWDPYQLNYGNGEVQISAADWLKLYARLDNMRPQLMRVMTNTIQLIRNGKFDPEYNFYKIEKILKYCQSRNVTVILGDWGGKMVYPKNAEIDTVNIRYAADYADFLVNKKGYSCIKYYNMINEPNGYWSSNEGNYDLWAKAIKRFQSELIKHGLDKKFSLVAPDIAIWTNKETWWIDSCNTQFKGTFGLYDIHTYPSKITVNSGEYSNIIRAYKDRVPKNRKIVMGEIGFKYIEPADSLYARENERRIKAKAHASGTDSQMLVYDYMYGTDMADALFQTVNEGYSGSVVWMLDDAMHSNESPDKLKIWGFWNILGEEYFGADEEAVRPWYYAMSLLTRYMPQGAVVYGVKAFGQQGVRAIAVQKEGKYMLAVVNTNKEKESVKIQSSTLGVLKNMKQYIYAQGMLIKNGDSGLTPNSRNFDINPGKGFNIEMPSESLIVYTNFDY